MEVTKGLQTAQLTTPTALKPNVVRDLTGALNILLAETFAVYRKTKNFHWHISGPHFRDYHLLLDEQGDQIFATTDAILRQTLNCCFGPRKKIYRLLVDLGAAVVVSRIGLKRRIQAW